jgi:hypothetical protein
MSRNHRNRKRDWWIEKKRAKNDEHNAKHNEWYKKYFTLADIVEILQSHPADCVFELNAPQNIVDRLSVRSRGEWLLSRREEFVNCFIQSEIYCPHEGVDRRAEYSMKVE